MEIAARLRVILFLGLAGVVAISLGCAEPPSSGGSSNDGVPPDADLVPALSLSLEDISAAGLDEAYSDGVEGVAANPAPVSSEPSAPEGEWLDVPPPPAPPWWLMLHPLRPRARDEARPVLEAPSHLFFYVMRHRWEMPPCVSITESGSCPFNPSAPDGACSTLVSFEGRCRLEFAGEAGPVGLDLSGALIHEAAVSAPSSGPDRWDGKWTEVIRAGAFHTSLPGDVRTMTYNGESRRSSDGTLDAAPYTWRHVGESDRDHNPMTVVDGRGDFLEADGVRETWVIPGDSVEEFVDSYPTLVPAIDPVPRHFHRTLHRTFVRDGSTVNLSVDAASTNLDRNATWTREGNYEVVRQNPTKVLVNGSAALTGPDGRRVSTEVMDVVHDLNHRVPISGQVITDFGDGRVVTVTFSGVCLVHWEDNFGQGGQVNFCQGSDFRE